MTVTAVSHEAISLSKLLQLVSECDEFQVATGTTAPAGALDFIFAPEKRNETEDQQEDQSPPVFAVVTVPEGGLSETEFIAGGGSNQFLLRGRWKLTVVRQMQSANKTDEFIEALNLFGAIRTHLLNYAGVDDDLSIIDIDWNTVYASSEANLAGWRVQKPVHIVDFLVAWGPGA